MYFLNKVRLYKLKFSVLDQSWMLPLDHPCRSNLGLLDDIDGYQSVMFSKGVSFILVGNYRTALIDSSMLCNSDSINDFSIPSLATFSNVSWITFSIFSISSSLIPCTPIEKFDSLNVNNSKLGFYLM